IKSLATNPDIPIRAVQDQMQKQFEVGVSKMKAFRAKRIASNIMTSSYRERYSLLREYAQELINQNPTVRIDVQQEPNPESLTRIFRRLYVCFGALKQGQILTTVEVDANNGIYPVAYAIVEAESKAKAKATSEGEFKKKMGELKSFNFNAYDWLMKIPLEQWSRAHFPGRAKCDLLINNISEVFNRQLVDGKDQPIITCLEYIREYLMKRIVVVQKVIAKTVGPLTPSVTKMFNVIKKKATEYNVQWNGVGVGIPEQWVYAALELVKSRTVIILPLYKPLIGRPPKKRKKSNDEIASQSASCKGKSVSCDKCGNVGHNRKGCMGQGGGFNQAGARKVCGQAAGSRKVSSQVAGARNVSGQAASARKASSQPSVS
ncbi:hypothetical protein Tco_1479297, partial [Tanacetum coccineum]